MGSNRRLTKHQLRKKARGICVESGCSRKLAKGRAICYHHVHEAYKEKHPLMWAFGTLRRNAKRRGKEFSITFDEFKKFCSRTKILLGRGITKDSYHIDRIDESKGYSIDNIQVLTNSENVKKYRDYDYMTGNGKTRTIRYENKNDLPF